MHVTGLLCIQLQARIGSSDEADMISTAGKYLLEVLTTVEYVLVGEQIVLWGMLTVAVAGAGLLAAYFWKRR